MEEWGWGRGCTDCWAAGCCAADGLPEKSRGIRSPQQGFPISNLREHSTVFKAFGTPRPTPPGETLGSRADVVVDFVVVPPQRGIAARLIQQEQWSGAARRGAEGAGQGGYSKHFPERAVKIAAKEMRWCSVPENS